MRRISPALGRFFLWICIPAALALCLALDAPPIRAAQAGAQKQSAGSNADASKRKAASAPDVYGQAPFTEKELVSFMESMPHFLAWVRTGKAKVHPMVNAAGKPDFAYTPEAAAKVRELGWEPERFFCLLGRSAAALYLVEEGTDILHALPPDMPTVTAGELALVRKHLASLLRAGTGGAAPALSR